MEPVLITGLGVISPLGNSVELLTRRFAAGERANGGTGSETNGVQVAEIPLRVVPADKRSRIGRLDRLCRMFLCASFLAVDDADLEIAPGEAERIGLSFGTGLGCLLTNAEYNRKVVAQGPAAASPQLFAYTVSSAAAGEVSIALGIHGPNVTVHMGLAAGLGAIGYGFDLIQMGKADVVLAGGADVTGPALVQGLRDMGLLKGADQSRPFHDAVPGVWPSEGSVVAVLERADRARRRGARTWGRIDGYAAGFEPTLTRKKPLSTGVTATLRRALELSGRTPDEVGLVLSGAHGTPVDATEATAMAEVFGSHRPLVLAPKAALGESFAASGVLALALASGLLHETPALTPSFGWSFFDNPPDASEAESRLRTTPVVMVESLCYSGNIVSLLIGRDV